MSDTPRTDSYTMGTAEPCGPFVPVEFAQQLERELAAALKERDEGQAALRRAIYLIAHFCPAHIVEVQNESFQEFTGKLMCERCLKAERDQLAAEKQQAEQTYCERLDHMRKENAELQRSASDAWNETNKRLTEKVALEQELIAERDAALAQYAQNEKLRTALKSNLGALEFALGEIEYAGNLTIVRALDATRAALSQEQPISCRREAELQRKRRPGNLTRLPASLKPAPVPRPDARGPRNFSA